MSVFLYGPILAIILNSVLLPHEEFFEFPIRIEVNLLLSDSFWRLFYKHDLWKVILFQIFSLDCLGTLLEKMNFTLNEFKGFMSISNL